MTGTINIVRTEVLAELTVPEEVLEPNVGYRAEVLGLNLAEQVQRHVSTAGLGYYPALDYFRGGAEGVDPALLALIDEVLEYCAAYTERELKRRLSRAFSHVAIRRHRPTAFGMPRVRPGRPDSLERLARHYAPNTLRSELVLSSIEREAVEGLEQLAVHKLRRWCEPAFARIQVASSRILPASA